MTAKKDPKDLQRRGRKAPKFSPERLQEVTNYCYLSARNMDLARFLEISEATLNRWLLDYPEFREAVYSGREGGDAEVVHAFRRRAMGYSHETVHITTYRGKVIKIPYTKHYPPDTEAAKFYLKNRHPHLFREKIDIEASGTIAIHVDADDEVL